MFCFNVNVSVSVVDSVCFRIDIRMFSQWIFRDRYRPGVQLEFPIQFAKLVNICDICPLC